MLLVRCSASSTSSHISSVSVRQQNCNSIKNNNLPQNNKDLTTQSCGTRSCYLAFSRTMWLSQSWNPFCYLAVSRTMWLSQSWYQKMIMYLYRPTPSPLFFFQDTLSRLDNGVDALQRQGSSRSAQEYPTSKSDSIHLASVLPAVPDLVLKAIIALYIKTHQ